MKKENLPVTHENVNEFYKTQLSLAKQTLEHYEHEITALTDQVAAIEITNDEENGLAIELGTKCNRIEKAIEDKRLELVKAPKAYAKAIDDLAKYFKDLLKKGADDARAKINDYLRLQRIAAQKAEEERQRVERALREKLEKEAAKLNAKAKNKDTEAPPVVVPEFVTTQTVEQPNTIRSKGGAATQVKTWTYEIIDPLAVPREYLMINETAIRQAIREGLRDLPGIRIYEEINVRLSR